MEKKKFNQGFTLIELLIVIAIIGILSSVILMSLNSARKKANDTQRIASVNQIVTAIALYQSDNEGTPPGIDGIEYVNGNSKWIPGLVPKYMSSVPSDPIDKNSHKFHYSRRGNNYEVISFLEKHKDDPSCGNGGGGGGSACQYYEKGSGEFLALMNPGASGWRFADSIEIVETVPRIMFWWGKVNQHVDNQGVWQSDPDGISGADLDQLIYCKKWYSGTTSVKVYKLETISNWRRGIDFEQSGYTSTKTSYECMQE